MQLGELQGEEMSTTLVKPFKESRNGDSVGLEIQLSKGRLRVGWFISPNPTLTYFAPPRRASMTWDFPMGSWQMRFWRLAVAYKVTAF